jgi:LCP family protein required for cell wall assembly
MTDVIATGRPRRSATPHRTWKQRTLLIAGSTATVGCLISAASVWYLGSLYAGINRITIIHAEPTTVAVGSTPNDQLGAGPGVSAATSPTEVDLGPAKATNILLTGSDGRSCIDPKSPYAGAYLANGSDIGNRSDTIILMHLDPATKQLGLLSFPRDLWVPIAGTNHKDRINSAFRAEDPNQLIQTIESTFGLRVDHYLGVDFCAFKSLVDATGGISIPFQFPTRDLHTGLEVTEVGCHQMGGDESLAYVRSRYYEYNDNGRWIGDNSSDYGRIARQQDFIRRLASRALSKGATNPITAKHLLDVARSSNVLIDDGLSLSDLIRLARTISNLGPETASSYRIEGHGQLIGGASVIVPDLTSAASMAILSFFRGATAPTTSADSGPTTVAKTTAPAVATSSAPAVPTPDSAPPPAASEQVSTTAPVSNNDRGVFPPADISCP